MTYTTPERVQNVLGGFYTLTTSSKVTLNMALEWIDEYSAELNLAVKRGGYAPPLTGTNDKMFARRLVTDIVAYRVLVTALPAASLPDTWRGKQSEWNRVMKEMMAGDFTFIEATRDEDGSATGYVGYLRLGSDFTANDL
jgi:hypothetical protein